MVHEHTARAAVTRWLILSVAVFGCWVAPLEAQAQLPRTATADLFTFVPKNLDELRLIEDRVQQVVEQVMPATVGIVAPSGQGSGVIVSADGYILTAGHVIREANLPLTIILPDGRRVKGKSLGINRTMDSGMAKITDPGVWPYAELGKASPLKRGQWVISLGHPGGYRQDRPPVVRLGRLSMNTRMVIVSNCTLVGGDSGGPLFDFDGKVVGIHSRIGSATANNMHVPIDTFLSTWDRLAKAEVWGVKVTPSSSSVSGAVLGVYTLDHDRGALVDALKDKGPAELAGVRVGDIITRIDGEPITSRDKLGEVLGKRSGGQVATLGIIRNGRNMDLSVKLDPRP